jgi:hypothetical protein
MAKIFTLPFQFHGVEYYLLVEIKQLEANTPTYHVTAITESDARIYGAFVFTRKNKKFFSVNDPDLQTAEIVHSLTAALDEYFFIEHSA